jgi:hypothetical protein
MQLDTVDEGKVMCWIEPSRLTFRDWKSALALERQNGCTQAKTSPWRAPRRLFLPIGSNPRASRIAEVAAPGRHAA